jgi:hypothetical protein
VMGAAMRRQRQHQHQHLTGAMELRWWHQQQRRF